MKEKKLREKETKDSKRNTILSKCLLKLRTTCGQS